MAKLVVDMASGAVTEEQAILAQDSGRDSARRRGELKGSVSPAANLARNRPRKIMQAVAAERWNR